MTEFRGVLELQVDTIVGKLRQRQESQCRQLTRHAESEAEELLHVTRRKLLQRGREAVREERRRREKALLQARHRIRAAAGHQLQELYAELLRDAWPELIAELENIWASEEYRRAWCEDLLDQALKVFGQRGWTIELPPGWSGEDGDWLADALGTRGILETSYRKTQAFAAGLRILSDTACLDGTITGLLADRLAVEGRLLAAWEQTADGDADD